MTAAQKATNYRKLLEQGIKALKNDPQADPRILKEAKDELWVARREEREELLRQT